MKHLKYLFVSILCGAGVVLGGLIVAISFPEILQRSYTAEDNEDRIKSTENRIGISCTELYMEAMDFVQSDIEKVMGRAKSGHSRVELLSDSQRRFMAKMKRPLFDCTMLKDSAAALDYNWPEHEQVMLFFNTLLHTHGKENGENIISQGEAYLLLNDYQNVTSQAKRTRLQRASS